jgi:hypothetical protein
MSSWTFCLHVPAYITNSFAYYLLCVVGSDLALFAPVDFNTILESPIPISLVVCAVQRVLPKAYSIDMRNQHNRTCTRHTQGNQGVIFGTMGRQKRNG